MFGDHLPTMGLEDDDMKTNSIYKTKYITWNNFGLEKEDADLYSYELLSSITDSVGIHEGTIFNYEQTSDSADSPEFLDGLENLQYDLLYGDRFSYGDEDVTIKSDLVMGTEDVVIKNVALSFYGDSVFITGANFTNWSKVYINDTKVATKYINSTTLKINTEDIKDGDSVVVSQLGSSDTRFRDSNEFIYEDPNSTETESTEPESETETETESSK